MRRDEILAANPIADFVRNRGAALYPTSDSTVLVSNACPVKEHRKFHRCNTIDTAQGLWHCNDHDVGGSVIDWLAIEKKIAPAEAMQQLGGGFNGANPPATRPQIIAMYDYTDEAGKLLFQCVRYEPKDFRQRRPDGKGGSIWNLQGVERVLYRLPQVIAAQTVVITEGEKDADNLAKLGFTTTTNCGGAKKWREEYSETLRGKDVIVFGDNDDDGRKHVEQVIESLTGVARLIKRLTLPHGLKDVSDYIASLPGGTAAQAIEKLIDEAPAEEKDLSRSVSTDVVGIKDLDAYNENDGGNAEMFTDRYSEIVRYNHAVELWFIWDGTRWLADAAERVHQLALELSKTLAEDLLKRPGRPDGQKLRRAIAMGSQAKISATLWLARSDPRIVIRREEIDVDNFLLGARNGVIDLRTGQKRAGQKGDFITKSCGCNYDPKATAPRWIGFLKEIFNEQADLIDYIQRAVGYSLTGDTREQCLFFLYGAGANGKSTFIEVLVKLLGDYATTASQNVLCFNRYGREPLDEIASLEGARLVSIAETGAEHMAEVRIKLLTGGDTVTGKAHYKAATSFQPKFKLWIFGNSKPAIYGVDFAIWRRIKLIPFTVQFTVEKQDSTLKEKLFAELPGILNWAIEGALKWQSEGRFVPPECVVKATEEYRADSDILRDFIAEKVEPAKGRELAHKDLYRAYKDWHAEESSERPFTSKKIAQMFRDRGYKAFSGTARKLSWWGIGLKSE